MNIFQFTNNSLKYLFYLDWKKNENFIRNSVSKITNSNNLIFIVIKSSQSIAIDLRKKYDENGEFPVSKKSTKKVHTSDKILISLWKEMVMFIWKKTIDETFQNVTNNSLVQRLNKNVTLKIHRRKFNFKAKKRMIQIEKMVSCCDVNTK